MSYTCGKGNQKSLQASGAGVVFLRSECQILQILNFLCCGGDMLFFPVLHVTIRLCYLVGQIFFKLFVICD